MTTPSSASASAPPTNDILLTTALGRCIRFAADDVRVFAGRDSTGVRGVRLAEGDSVISMAILRGVDATADERARLPQARRGHAPRGGRGDRGWPVESDDGEDESAGEAALSVERIAVLEAAEEVILTMSSEGVGKRTSAYDFRRTGRGGQGLLAQDLTKRGGRLVAAFPVDQHDEVLMVTDQGQLIRCPVARHPHRRAQHPGRDRVPHRRERARGLGRAAGRREAERTTKPDEAGEPEA